MLFKKQLKLTFEINKQLRHACTCIYIQRAYKFIYIYFFKKNERTYSSLQLHWMLSIPIENHQHQHPLAQF